MLIDELTNFILAHKFFSQFSLFVSGMVLMCIIGPAIATHDLYEKTDTARRSVGYSLTALGGLMACIGMSLPQIVS